MKLSELIFGKRFWMESPLSQSDCVERLKKETRERWLFFGADPFSNKPFVGIIEEDSIHLRRTDFITSIYQTTLHAWLLTDGDRTLLDCTCALNQNARIVLALWYLLAVPIAGYLFLFSPSPTYSSLGHIHKSTTLSDAMLFMYMLVLPVVTVLFCQIFGRHEERRLVEFLESTIGAQRV
ncbi:MAG: hypothetical protein ACOH12_07390 [Parvibaculaceae bacterium]